MIIIGENLHCSRLLKRGGARCPQLADGRVTVAWGTGTAGAAQFTVPPALAKERVRHVAAAIAVGRAATPDSAAALAYLRFLTDEQVRAGAGYLDLNVDEYSTDRDENTAALCWLIGQVRAWTSLPLALDSSAPEMLRAGAEFAAAAGVPIMLNSASAERPEVLEVAARLGAAVLCSAAGAAQMPTSAAERVAGLAPVVQRAQALGLPLNRLFLDPLVLPVSTDGAQGPAFVTACRQLRETYGPAVHLTGGISNVSFGMPERRLLNHVFLELAAEAGLDAPIADPLQLAPLAWPPAWRTAARNVLSGTDEFAAAFLELVRAESGRA